MEPIRKKQSTSLIALIWLIALILGTLPLLCSFLGEIHPAFDSLSHLRRQMVFALAIATIPLFFTSLRRAGFGLFIFLAAVFTTTIETGGRTADRSTENSTRVYTLVQANLRFDNQTPEKFTQLVALEKPDFVTFQEASLHWQPTIERIAADHGFYLRQCVRQSTGMAIGATGILSRFPFKNDDALFTCRRDAANMTAFIDINGKQQLKLSAFHLHWPWPFGQKTQLEEMQFGREHPQIIAGDFNAVTWSYTVNLVEQKTETRHIKGIYTSWLRYGIPEALRSLFGLPIDHALVSDDIEVHNITHLPSIGSDHLPLRIDFSFKPQTVPNLTR